MAHTMYSHLYYFDSGPMRCDLLTLTFNHLTSKAYHSAVLYAITRQPMQ